VRINTALGDPKDIERFELVAADKGYFKTDELWLLHELEIQAAIRDPLSNRRLDKLTESEPRRSRRPGTPSVRTAA
jgi:hypothetical protein